jgi:hypothetical protein
MFIYKNGVEMYTFCDFLFSSQPSTLTDKIGEVGYNDNNNNNNNNECTGVLSVQALY